ncbi:MAG TPA: hypothetical protein VKS79_23960 [Gemmataceae bacterium]|nr:hypothetical protein [Gemmataceae bacterium]
MASLPHVVQLNTELGSFGLVVVGAHSQKATNEQVKSISRSHGVNFTVTEGATVQGGNDFNGIPHVMVFDHTGKCVYRGSPAEAERFARLALGKALAAKLEGTSSKSVTSLLDSLKKGTSPATVLQRALSLSKGSDKDTAEPAKELVAQLTDAGEKMIGDIEKMRSSDPVDAFPRALRLSQDLKGTPQGNKANEIVTELKKDKTVVQEVKARPILEGIHVVDEALQEALGKDDPKSKEFHKAQAGPLKQLQTAIKKMKTTYPEAPSTKEALEIAEKYGLLVK